MTNRTRVALLVAAAVVVVAGFALARGSGSEEEGGTRADDPPAETTPARTTPAGTTTTRTTATPPRIPTIAVRDGRPVGGVRELSFRTGETIRFRVRADAPYEVHVHGYDVYRDLVPGRTAGFRIPAEIDGRFEVELHDQPQGQIAELEVTP